MSAVALLLAAALICWPNAGRVAARARVRRVLDAPDSPRISRLDGARRWSRSHVGPLAAGLAVAVAAGWPGGLVAGALTGFVAQRALRRFSARSEARARAELARTAPPVLDLLASAMRAGLSLARAAEIVADADRGPLAPDLHRVAALARLGAAGGAEWDDYRDDPVWGPVARAARRSAASGSALAAAVERVADDLREEQGQRAHAIAQRAAILVMGPLGLCFLPAFICIGVVPVIVGLLSGVLG